jgi:hypothetical protein
MDVRHPNKHIHEVICYAVDRGWTFRKSARTRSDASTARQVFAVDVKSACTPRRGALKTMRVIFAEKSTAVRIGRPRCSIERFA